MVAPRYSTERVVLYKTGLFCDGSGIAMVGHVGFGAVRYVGPPRRTAPSAHSGLSDGSYCAAQLTLGRALFATQLELQQRDPLQARTRRQTYNETLLTDPSQRNSTRPALHNFSAQELLSADMARNESVAYANMQPVWLVSDALAPFMILSGALCDPPCTVTAHGEPLFLVVHSCRHFSRSLAVQ